MDITAKPFDWNDNLSKEALEDFEGIQKDLPYCTCQNIGMALAKLELLEKQGQEPKTGHWEWVRYDGIAGNWHCSECRTIIPHMPEETDNTPIYKWCPMCGAKIQEVKDNG